MTKLLKPAKHTSMEEIEQEERKTEAGSKLSGLAIKKG